MKKPYLSAVLLALSITTTVEAFSHEETAMHNNVLLERSKRQLLWPNTTVLQFNVGVATPTPLKTIMVNWAFQANFQLPWNRSQVPVDILHANSGYEGDSRSERDAEYGANGIQDEEQRKASSYIESSMTGEREITTLRGRSKTTYESPRNERDADMSYKETETGEQYHESDTGLYQFYKYAAEMLNGFGYNGTDCVLRALCQIGAEPLHTDDEEDLLHELASFVLNPNNDLEDSPLPEDHEAHAFVEAYNRGQRQYDCHTIHQCPMSLVDMFTVVQGSQD